MIDLPHHSPLLAHGADHVKIKVLGLGNAGLNALDRLLLDGLDFAEGLAINTDVQALTASVAPAKIQIGRMTTRGLGAGGDPEVGLEAAEEGVGDLQSAVEGAELIFLCTGLGGGTGSGAAALLAAQAREQGAMVVAFVTMPFAFEGRRRRAQAEDALHALREAADVVICFENDRMGESVSPQAGIHQAFAAADLTLSQSIRAVCELFKRPGLMSIGFGDLTRVLGGQHACCLFGHGESETDNRAHEALARALKSPLMDRGRMLHEASAVLVNIAGGPSLTLNEVQILMEEFNKYIGSHTQIFFGTAIDPKLGNKLAVTIISSLGGDEVAALPPRAEPQREVIRRVAAPPVVKAMAAPAITPAPEPVAVPVAASSPVAKESVFFPSIPTAPVLEVMAEPEQEPESISQQSAADPSDDEEGVETANAPAFAEAHAEASADATGEELGGEVEHAGEAEVEVETEAEPAFASFAEPTPEREPELEAAPEPEPEPEPAPIAASPFYPTESPAPVRPARPVPARPSRSFAPEPMLPMEMPAARDVAKVPQQETLPFEPVSRGRFEKSEPTIVDGQDLDVPTFMRRNLRVK